MRSSCSNTGLPGSEGTEVSDTWLCFATQIRRFFGSRGRRIYPEPWEEKDEKIKTAAMNKEVHMK